MTVTIRRATQYDLDLLFNWLNEPDSLAGKLLTTGPIAREQHETWFAARLADPQTLLWIIESDRQPIGQLRLMKKADAYEVDIYVTKARRRAGVAQEALNTGIAMLKHERAGSQIVRALVKPDNTSSQRLFERAGFALAARTGDHLVYELIAQ
jgi:RimJ/RimL family protein N-acetyltransferase